MWGEEWSWQQDFQCKGPGAGVPLARQRTGPRGDHGHGQTRTMGHDHDQDMGQSEQVVLYPDIL